MLVRHQQTKFNRIDWLNAMLMDDHPLVDVQLVQTNNGHDYVNFDQHEIIVCLNRNIDDPEVSCYALDLIAEAMAQFPEGEKPQGVVYFGKQTTL